MTLGSTVLILGGAVLGALALMAMLFGGFSALSKVGDAIVGLPRIRRAMLAQGIDPRLVARIADELSGPGRGAGIALLLGVAGASALAYGLSVLSAAHYTESWELVLYPAPGAIGVVLAIVLLAQSRLVPDESPTHEALFTRGAQVTALVPTNITLALNVTTVGDALASTRVTRATAVPHVVLRFEDGTDVAVRAFHDQDVLACQTLRALQQALPDARVEPFTPHVVRAHERSTARAA